MSIEDIEDSEKIIHLAAKIFRNLTDRPPMHNEDIPIVLKIATTLVYIKNANLIPVLKTERVSKECLDRLLQGWISIYQYGDEVRIQPTLYPTKEAAIAGLYSTLGNYRSSHLKFVCEPIYVSVQPATDK